ERGPALSVIDPDVSFGRREFGEVDVERTAGDAHPARLGDDAIWADPFGVIHDRTAAQQFGLLRCRRLGIGKHLVALLASILEEGRERTVNGVAGVDIDPWISLADVPIAGGMIEVPMAVDDRRDRPVARLGIVED